MSRGLRISEWQNALVADVQEEVLRLAVAVVLAMSRSNGM